MPKTKKKDQVLGELTEKQLAELRAIDTRLQQVLEERRAGQAAAATPMRLEKQIGSITFRYETVRCGKDNCTRCPHGPYWYAYWKEGGRTRSRYIGRQLPGPAKQVYEEKQKAKAVKE